MFHNNYPENICKVTALFLKHLIHFGYFLSQSSPEMPMTATRGNSSMIIVYCLWTSFPIILCHFHCLLLFVIYTFTSHIIHRVLVSLLLNYCFLCFFWILFSGYSCAGASSLCLVWIIVFLLLADFRLIIFYKVLSVIL